MRLVVGNDGENYEVVSIHASVKDATNIEFHDPNPVTVSIHASVKDATLNMAAGWSDNKFQSTHL